MALSLGYIVESRWFMRLPAMCGAAVVALIIAGHYGY
jgi:hypothetical protein